MKIIKRIFYFFLPNASDRKDFEKTFMALSIVMFSSVLSLMLVLYYFMTKYKLGSPGLANIELVVAILAAGVPFLYKKTNRYNLSANILISFGMCIVVAATFYTGGIESPVIFWISLCPMCAGMVQSKKSVVYWGIISFFIPVMFLVFDGFIKQIPGLINDPKLIESLKMRAIFGSIVFSSISTYFYRLLHEQSVEKLKDANLQVKNLLRVVGHDVSNPLSIVTMSADIGIRSASNQKEEKLWMKVTKAGHTIREIIEQVRSLQALETGKMELELSAVDVEEIIEKGKFLFYERLKQKDLDITFTSDSSTTLVMAEPISFSNQVINNLLSNAIKFSNPGGRIEVTCVSKMNEVDIIIKDQGIGIPRSIIANLFDYRSKTSRIGTAGEQGTGFGMPIVKFYVEQYGGDIEVESRPLEEYTEGHGTIFTITLKKHHAEEKKVAS